MDKKYWSAVESYKLAHHMLLRQFQLFVDNIAASNEQVTYDLNMELFQDVTKKVQEVYITDEH